MFVLPSFDVVVYKRDLPDGLSKGSLHTSPMPEGAWQPAAGPPHLAPSGAVATIRHPDLRQSLKSERAQISLQDAH